MNFVIRLIAEFARLYGVFVGACRIFSRIKSTSAILNVDSFPPPIPYIDSTLRSVVYTVDVIVIDITPVSLATVPNSSGSIFSIDPLKV